jgi:hypothetical protein
MEFSKINRVSKGTIRIAAKLVSEVLKQEAPPNRQSAALNYKRLYYSLSFNSSGSTGIFIIIPARTALGLSPTTSLLAS